MLFYSIRQVDSVECMSVKKEILDNADIIYNFLINTKPK